MLCLSPLMITLKLQPGKPSEDWLDKTPITKDIRKKPQEDMK